jgi:hypothetical protein
LSGRYSIRSLSSLISFMTSALWRWTSSCTGIELSIPESLKIVKIETKSVFCILTFCTWKNT